LRALLFDFLLADRPGDCARLLAAHTTSSARAMRVRCLIFDAIRVALAEVGLLDVRADLTRTPREEHNKYTALTTPAASKPQRSCQPTVHRVFVRRQTCITGSVALSCIILVCC
jgi:hypothetical protein